MEELDRPDFQNPFFDFEKLGKYIKENNFEQKYRFLKIPKPYHIVQKELHEYEINEYLETSNYLKTIYGNN